MATRKDTARMQAVTFEDAFSALSDAVGVSPDAPPGDFVKPIRKALLCRKKKPGERLTEYLWIIGAGVSIGVIKRKAQNKVKFYQSWEWKKARYSAIKASSQRCLCCGWQVGDTPHGHLVVDHIKPRSKFPELALDPDNLQVLCNDCNMGKSNESCDDWRGMEERFRATIQ